MLKFQKNKFWLTNIWKKIKNIWFVQKKSFLSILFNKNHQTTRFEYMILWLLLWHFNDCNEKRTRYPAANRVLCHNIIYSKHVVWWFLLNKMDKRDFFLQK